jgi:prepilin-type N-terminal cleavage/methylation domain-containing protein
MTRARGYTLIELTVSVAIFSIIMLMATSSYLALVGYARFARSEGVVMTNLSYAVESIARSIRTGANYQCNGAGDCSSGTSLTFTDDSGRTITYVKDQDALVRCVNHPVGCGASTGSVLTDPSITIQNLRFYVRGTGSYGSGDRAQPSVLISIQGQAAVKNQSPVNFSFQTTATERLIDL